mgnify:CR=1 FL=1
METLIQASRPSPAGVHLERQAVLERPGVLGQRGERALDDRQQQGRDRQ